nr:zinc finger BED domain-containing protein DAYSLEEPER [Tanacetum cinerariifolium]
MNKSCPPLKAATGSSQTTIRVDGSLWQYKAARVQDRMAKFVIQETLPFDHFNNKRMTSLIQDTLQPRYCYGIEKKGLHRARVLECADVVPVLFFVCGSGVETRRLEFGIFNLNRDAYGFAATPQHVQRY